MKKKGDNGGKRVWLFYGAQAEQKGLVPFPADCEEKMTAPKGSGTFWFYELFPKKSQTL